MKKLNPKIIRVGDTVKIINPEFFTGCYYDINIKDTSAEIAEKYRDEITNFVCKLAGIIQPTKLIDILQQRNPIDDIAINKVARVVAYEIVARNRRTGNVKRVHTEFLEEEKDLLFRVSGIQYIQSGVYNSAHYGTPDYWTGEVDWDPAYLSDRKHHKILILGNHVGQIRTQMQWRWQDSSDALMIDAKNVEKVL